MTRIRIGLLLGLLLVLALAVAACGGGDKRGGVASLGDDKPTTTSPGSGGGDSTQADLAYARCMRQHGDNLPDPQITANGITQQNPTGMSRNDPRLRAAEQACRQQGGGGGKR